MLAMALGNIPHVRSKKHIKAQARILDIFKKRGWLGFEELPAPQLTELGFRAYQFDTCFIKDHVAVAVEIDGKVGHSSPRAIWKGVFRDINSKENLNVLTARLKTDWVVGRECVSDQTIIDEIEFQLKQKYGVEVKI